MTQVFCCVAPDGQPSCFPPGPTIRQGKHLQKSWKNRKAAKRVPSFGPRRASCGKNVVERILSPVGGDIWSRSPGVERDRYWLMLEEFPDAAPYRG